MPLLTCPECTGTVSDQALSCPHCGHPMHLVNPPKLTAHATKAFRWGLWINLVVLFIGVPVFVALSGRMFASCGDANVYAVTQLQECAAAKELLGDNIRVAYGWGCGGMEEGPAGSHSSGTLPVKGDKASGSYSYKVSMTGGITSFSGALEVDGKTLQMLECAGVTTPAAPEATEAPAPGPEAKERHVAPAPPESSSGLDGLRQVDGPGTANLAEAARMLRRISGGSRACYRKERHAHPQTAGTVTLRVEVAATGRVTGVKVASDTTGRASLASCIARKARLWRFPPPEGGSVTLEVPMAFEPTKGTP